MFNRKIAGLLVGLSLLPASTAAGQTVVVEGSPLPTEIVNYADLDLSKLAGRAALDRRVRRAAEFLCVNNGIRGFREQMEQKACLNFAIASARPQIVRAINGHGTQLAMRKAIVVVSR